MTNPTPHGQVPAIQRYKIGYHSDDWGMRSSTPSGIPDDAGAWVCYEDHAAQIAALRAQQPAPAAGITVEQVEDAIGLQSTAWDTIDAKKIVEAVLRLVNGQAPATQQAGEVSESIEQLAVARYKVVPAHESMFHRWAVVAGDGAQQLYLGREVECENMARKFAGAFLDGAFYQANITPPTQASEYPALVCDYCGALTPDPWHSSGMLHGKMSKHIHSCDACAARGAAQAQDTREPLADEQIQDLLLCGNPTDEEMRLIRIGWDAANGIKGGQHGVE